MKRNFSIRSNRKKGMPNRSHFYGANKGAHRCLLVWDDSIDGDDLPFSFNADDGTMIVADLGHRFHDWKLIGNMDTFGSGLKRLSLHMKGFEEYGNPRLYFTYDGDDDLHYIEFTPGTDVVMLGRYKVKFEDFDKQKDDGSFDYDATKKAEKEIYRKAFQSDDGWMVEQLE